MHPNNDKRRSSKGQTPTRRVVKVNREFIGNGHSGEFPYPIHTISAEISRMKIRKVVRYGYLDETDSRHTTI